MTPTGPPASAGGRTPNPRPWRRSLAATAVLVVVCVVWSLRRPTIPPPLTQDAYVWQRQWTPAVAAAVTAERPAFARLIALAADVRWTHGQGHVTTVHVGDTDGVAIRVGPRGRDFDAAAVALLGDAARSAVAGRHVAELQLDYDCGETRLADYAGAVSAVRTAVAPTPVVVTALPSWLAHRDAFAVLAAGGFVLQVHSLHPPPGPDGPLSLCDADEATRAVERADTFGVPFRVALPTYGYVAGFTPAGQLIGLAAEGPPPAWPPGTVLREMTSDPRAIAALVRRWQSHRPTHLTGIIWYRLPVAGDALNWRPPTLHAVMHGRDPRSHLSIATTRAAGLTDVAVVNDGEADAPFPTITATWSADAIAIDALPGYTLVDSQQGRVTFRPTADGRLAPGDRGPVGWIRLGTDTEVHADVTAPP